MPQVRTSGLLFLALLVSATTAVYLQGADLDPTARDQNADLAQALRVREQGELTDGSRSPLLPLLLAPSARRTPDFFVDARLIAVGLAALALVGFYLAVRRAFSPGLALLASLALWVEWRFQARRICPEPLLALLLVLAVAALAHLPSSPRPRRLALAAGVCLGLAWLAKGSAVLSLGVAVVWLAATLRRRALPHLALLGLAFVVVASPLLGWNLARGHWPLANASSDHVMWEDAWDQDLDKTSTATAGTWFASHSVADAVTRLGHGLVHQKAVEWPLGFLALLAVAALARRRAPRAPRLGPPETEAPRRAWRTLALLTCLAWLPPMAWYEPVVQSRRFLFPVVAILLPAALDVLGGLVPRDVRSRVRLPAWAPRAALAVALAVSVAAVVLVVRHASPWEERHVGTASLALVEELRKPRYRGTVVLAKPSRTLPPDWLLEGQVTFLALPAAVRDAEVERWVTGRAHYVLRNADLERQRPALFALDPGRGPGRPGEGAPPWLHPAWKGRGEGRERYALFRVVP